MRDRERKRKKEREDGGRKVLNRALGDRMGGAS